MASKPVLVVTNPLHFTYFRQKHDIAAIGSSQGLLHDYAQPLGFSNNLTLYNVPHGVDQLIMAHNQAEPSDSYITWKVTDLPVKLLGNSYALAHALEQKAYIRSLLPAELFPKFEVVPAAALASQTYAGLAERLAAERLVLQIDFSTGGKGTFFAGNQAELAVIMPTLQAAGQPVIVSEHVAGTARGLQCIVAGQTVYSTPWWHRDLVATPGIYNSSQPAATKYCGAVLEDIPSDFEHDVQALIQTVGARLAGEGYQGIFGIDIVVDSAAKQVYLIEINPRLTAVSHLYATAMRARGYAGDFITAQVEALTGTSTFSPGDFTAPRPLDQTYYYLKLQNQAGAAVQLTEHCRLGVYGEAGEYKRFGFGIDALQAPSDIVVIPECGHGVDRKPGERVFSIIGTGDPLLPTGISPALNEQLQVLSRQFLRAVG